MDERSWCVRISPLKPLPAGLPANYQPGCGRPGWLAPLARRAATMLPAPMVFAQQSP
jgi:hypothetical protein